MEIEDRIQAECFRWFQNEYRHIGEFCYNLNNSANKIRGGMNKSMGLRKGRNDATIYFSGGNTLLVEFKTKVGKQRPDQKKFQEKVEGLGFQYKIARNLVGFQAIIKEYITEKDIK